MISRNECKHTFNHNNSMLEKDLESSKELFLCLRKQINHRSTLNETASCVLNEHVHVTVFIFSWVSTIFGWLLIYLAKDGWGFMSDIPRIHLAELQSEVLSLGFRIPTLLSVPFSCDKSRSDCSKLPFLKTQKTTKKIAWMLQLWSFFDKKMFPLCSWLAVRFNQ